ncbi:MAG: ATP-binding cassette domain-containing protein [Devosia nanyangense]|uniref:ATP-binding cassette domain-containing protein n=1 Tax=Devosia nanyangense TaxID=1228055 RepID=A0A933L1T0_9HYPH|nr:ATP-binding cassette domain-containing protein [Devosia nanyangense]
MGIVLIAMTGLGPSMLGNSYWEHTFQLVNIYVAVAVFQNFLFVDAGQKSFGQGAILGLGAYGFAIAVGLNGLPVIIGLLAGIVAATAGGLLFALPALRVQGFHLGFVTMSAGIVFPQLLVQFDWLTRGINGISVKLPGLTDPLLFGLSPMTLIVTLFPILALLLHFVLRQSPLGRRMRIAAESPEAARSLGIRPGFMRSLAFVIASVGTGISGVLYVPAVGFISPQGFLVDLSFVFFFAVVVGGRGQLLGPIIGIWIIHVLPTIILVQLIDYRLLVYGILTLLVVILFPDGVVGTFESWRRKRSQVGGGERGFRLDRFTDAIRSMVPVTGKPSDVPIIEVRNATKKFGQVVAIEDVDMVVRPGEIHGLVGANGSGKTSLLNVLTGLSRLNSGTYSFNGRDVTRVPADAIAKLGLGRTFQTPRMFPSLSVWDNIRIGLDARDEALEPEFATLAQSLDRDFANDSPALLSHGQRRLVEVVRVVFKQSSILLFDEPAAGLSPEERAEFADLVRLLSRTLGKAIILVEHDLDLVWGIADTITVLETGRVVASGAPAVLAKDPAVQHLFVGGRHA